MGSMVAGGSGESSLHSSGTASPPVDDTLEVLWMAVTHLGLADCPAHTVQFMAKRRSKTVHTLASMAEAESIGGP